MTDRDHLCLTYPCAVCGEGEGLTLDATGELTIKGNHSVALRIATSHTWRMKKRPETPEEALSVVQALYDGGVTFHAYGDTGMAAAFAANPMLERVDQGDGGPPQEESGPPPRETE